MMWNYGGYSPMFSGMMFFMMIGVLAVYVVFLIAAWRLMRAHEYIAESLKGIAQHFKSKTPGNE